ncbi:DNA-binding transcriptional regulator, AcrR family [Streptomyces sp. 3213]|uniref:TetR/AcrR family transcriptional regulator n=1 Tax=Streptomyces sp. 3213.3 TaxID=1855348 RepID=UPI0008976CA6|nr:TetR/AcrR family transcriptional regulator [Streptomyces sp. 3213.3]SEE10544.1 DNA-binding transcriptional regulator, AcrR family [Streptomyces sp. 3213] [Streptomyces sp. 3213.3]
MGTPPSPAPSPRRTELLDACYAYLLEHGLTGLSLRPLAAATGTSPRVLLYLFGSKDELLRQLLARARHEQVGTMAAVLTEAGGDDFDALVDRLWAFLSAPEQRPMVRLTYEAFLLSLGRDPGPWAGFAGEAAREWLDLLARAQPPGTPPALAQARATRALALVRGLLLDLLACEEPERVRSALTLGTGEPAPATPPPPPGTAPR